MGLRVFKRLGGCNRCGFCCRVDYTNLTTYKKLDAAAQERGFSGYWPVCQEAVTENGLARCTTHNQSHKKCHLFPWHPDQLSNEIREDLPRIPVYCKDKTIYYGLPKGVDAPQTGWTPFSAVCTYRYEDVTGKLDPKAVERVKLADDPVVQHDLPVWARGLL